MGGRRLILIPQRPGSIESEGKRVGKPRSRFRSAPKLRESRFDLTTLTALTFRSIGLDIEDFLTTWLLPCGAMGAVIVGAWLAEAKQSVIENMAPVLARVRRGSRRRMLPIPVHKISTIHPRAPYTRKRASMGLVCPAGPVNGSKWIISQPEGLEPHVTSCCTMMSRRC